MVGVQGSAVKKKDNDTDNDKLTRLTLPIIVTEVTYTIKISEIGG